MSDDGTPASGAINDARALLATLLAAGWGDVHVQTGSTSIFIAMAGGQANPMRRTAPEAGSAQAEALPRTSVMAPHVATFVDAPAVGCHVAAGGTVARLGLLDEIIDVAAPTAGTIAKHHHMPGALVQFGDAVVDLD